MVSTGGLVVVAPEVVVDAIDEVVGAGSVVVVVDAEKTVVVAIVVLGDGVVVEVVLPDVLWVPGSEASVDGRGGAVVEVVTAEEDETGGSSVPVMVEVGGRVSAVVEDACSEVWGVVGCDDVTAKVGAEETLGVIVELVEELSSPVDEPQAARNPAKHNAKLDRAPPRGTFILLSTELRPEATALPDRYPVG